MPRERKNKISTPYSMQPYSLQPHALQPHPLQPHALQSHALQQQHAPERHSLLAANAGRGKTKGVPWWDGVAAALLVVAIFSFYSAWLADIAGPIADAVRLRTPAAMP